MYGANPPFGLNESQTGGRQGKSPPLLGPFRYSGIDSGPFFIFGASPCGPDGPVIVGKGQELSDVGKK